MARNVVTGIVETAAIAVGLCVKKGTAANGVVTAGAGEKSLGIADMTDFNESIAVGEQASIAVDGIVPAVAGGNSVSAVAFGDSLISDGSGKLIAPSGSTLPQERVAVAMEANTGVDNLFKVKVIIDQIIVA